MLVHQRVNQSIDSTQVMGNQQASQQLIGRVTGRGFLLANIPPGDQGNKGKDCGIPKEHIQSSYDSWF